MISQKAEFPDLQAATTSSASSIHGADDDITTLGDREESRSYEYISRGEIISEIEEELEADGVSAGRDLQLNQQLQNGRVEEDHKINSSIRSGVVVNKGGAYDHIEEDEHGLVYVVVRKGDQMDASMGALLWTLDTYGVHPSCTVYLVHVFPELKYVPSPFGNGKVPKSQVRPDQVEKYTEEERTKRRELLHKFIDKCHSRKIKEETILIESDMEAKAILELISVLRIKKLVLGVPKSSIRKLKSRKGNGVADQILRDAPEWCELKFICDGKYAMLDSINTSTASPTGSLSSSKHEVKDDEEEELQPSQPKPPDNNTFTTYCCFKT